MSEVIQQELKALRLAAFSSKEDAERRMKAYEQALQLDKPDFYVNTRNFQVPADQMKPQDILKHDLVLEQIGEAKRLSQMHSDFKRKSFSEVNDLISLVASEYDTKFGGAKGNISLTSFDGKFQISVKIDDQINFGPEIDIAKQLINEVIDEELADSSGFIVQLVRDAFETDKQGNYNKIRILALRKYREANTSDKWQNAMKALDDGIIAGSSKTYLNYQERDQFGAWKQIPLASQSL